MDYDVDNKDVDPDVELEETKDDVENQDIISNTGEDTGGLDTGDVDTDPLDFDVPDLDAGTGNPVAEVNLNATLEDGWYFANPQMEYLLPDLNNPYEGLYHLMEDGTAMVGEGVQDEEHEINPDDIILQDSEVDMETEGAGPVINPIITVGLEATDNDNFYFFNDRDTQYVGVYHIYQDGTMVVGEGVIGTVQDIHPADVIFRKYTYETLQEVREIVSDVFYKLWFEDYTLTDEQILSMQTTIRDGIKTTGRNENEPLVFYKKDRNTLENRQDLQGDSFEQICQNVYDNSIPVEDLEEKFTLVLPPEISYPAPADRPILLGEYWKLQQYIMKYENFGLGINVVIAEEAIKYYDEDLVISDDETPGGF